MISAALMLMIAPVGEAAPAFPEKPNFAFACRPLDQGSASPTYEYRVFVSDDRSSSQVPAQVELTKIEGLSQGMSSLKLPRGNLFVFLAPGADEGSPPMFKVDAFAGSLEDVLYDFSMIFTRSKSVNEDGVAKVSVSPSEGRLRIAKAGEDEDNFRAECAHIDTESVQ